jgi:uncharacterized membrane protein YdbT with pleckstrin-like domain
MNSPSPVIRKRISPKTFIGSYMGLGLLAIGIWTLGYLMRSAVPLALSAIVGFLALLIGCGYIWLLQASTEYRVFDESLEVESGILSRSIDNLQLFRVRDIGLSQSIWGRILNFGSISIASTDQSNPHLVLHGIDTPRATYDRLRELVARSQATRRTMIVEDEPHT